MLIDAGGTNSSVITNYLNKVNIKTFDVVVLTHPHLDHIQNAGGIIKSYNIKKLYMPRAITTTKTYEDLLRTIKEKNIKTIEAKAGVLMDIEDESIKLSVFAPNSSDYEKLRLGIIRRGKSHIAPQLKRL